jgi:DNA-binding transcriptional LysR family regulator
MNHILNCGWIDVCVVMDQIASGAPEIILPDWTLPSGTVHAVFPSRRVPSPAIRSLIDLVVLEFRA